MSDIFISFKSDDQQRVQPLVDGFRARGFSVFWSEDIPKGATDYHAIIKREIRDAHVAVVVWTFASVTSHAVTQECAQAEQDSKLMQVLLDRIEPIDFPMEVRFRSQKTMLFGWNGEEQNAEWAKLNDAIAKRLVECKWGKLASKSNVLSGVKYSNGARRLVRAVEAALEDARVNAYVASVDSILNGPVAPRVRRAFEDVCRDVASPRNPRVILPLRNIANDPVRRMIIELFKRPGRISAETRIDMPYELECLSDDALPLNCALGWESHILLSMVKQRELVKASPSILEDMVGTPSKPTHFRRLLYSLLAATPIGQLQSQIRCVVPPGSDILDTFEVALNGGILVLKKQGDIIAYPTYSTIAVGLPKTGESERNEY